MNFQEYDIAKGRLEKYRDAVHSCVPGTTEYVTALNKFLEALITVKGHAWCMDVQSERKKMSELVASAIANFIK